MMRDLEEIIRGVVADYPPLEVIIKPEAKSLRMEVSLFYPYDKEPRKPLILDGLDYLTDPPRNHLRDYIRHYIETVILPQKSKV